MNTEFPKAMHGPDDSEAVVQSAEEEKLLRKDGWIDGHEYWTAFREQTEGLPADLDAVAAEQKAAEVTGKPAKAKAPRKPRSKKSKPEASNELPQA